MKTNSEKSIHTSLAGYWLAVADKPSYCSCGAGGVMLGIMEALPRALPRMFHLKPIRETPAPEMTCEMRSV